MRKVDKLGRIVIPMELRKKYGLSEGASIDFSDSGDGIVVKALVNQCKICQDTLPDDTDFPLCELCAKRLAKRINEKSRK
jgi:transcriptional pleiotropic regulator of transition state genes